MEELGPQERIAQLEKQVEELLQQISELQKNIVDWHSVMFGALNLILKPHKFNLQMSGVVSRVLCKLSYDQNS